MQLGGGKVDGGGCGQGHHMDLGAFAKETATGLCPQHLRGTAPAHSGGWMACSAGRERLLLPSCSLQPALRSDALHRGPVSLCVVTGATVVAGVA